METTGGLAMRGPSRTMKARRAAPESSWKERCLAVGEVELIYFAQAARLAGTERETLSIEANTPLHQVQAEVLRRHPPLAELAGSLLWAVDEEMAGQDAPVGPGQVVAVMPPFSGG